MDARELVRRKLEGHALDAAEIDAFLGAYVAGEVADTVATALLAAIYQGGMEPEELFLWTRSMLSSGARLDLSSLPTPAADKHSTGGVGDKVSLPLAPAVAACGVCVPMISGRGLGHTGGTLDKLESIPGLTTELGLGEVRRVLERAGAVIAAQTDELVPADAKLYALRDATGLVASIPLITSSILSKKLAEDLDALVLDVKFGSGAFLPDPERGVDLGETMIAVARRFDVPATVFLTSMEQPLGAAVGHSLEVRESIECLRGGGPADLRELVVTFGAQMLVGAGAAATTGEGRRRIEAALDDGSGQDAFAAMIAAQGGDPEVVTEPERLPYSGGVALWLAPASGVLDIVDCRGIGRAVGALGGGRTRAGDAIDPAVGLLWRGRIGDDVRAGEPLAEIFHRGGKGLEEAEAQLAAAIAFDTGREASPLVLRRLGSEGAE